MTVFNHVAKRSMAFFVVTIMAAYVYSMGCGSSGTATTTDSTSSSDLTITGSVQQATVSANLAAKGLSKATTSQAADACKSLKCYQLTTGEEIVSTGSCGSDGTFSAAGSSAKTVGDGSEEQAASGADSWEVNMICVATSSTDKPLLGFCSATYDAATVDGTATTAIACDAINTDSTKVVMDILKSLGLTVAEFVADPKATLAKITGDLVNNFDVSCYQDMMDAILDDADSTGDGLTDDIAKVTETCDAYVAAATAPPTGVDSWEEFIDQCENGDLPADAQAAVVSVVEGAGLNADDFESGYADLGETIDGLHTVLVQNYAGNADAIHLGASISVGKSLSSDSPACANLGADSTYLGAVIDALMSADSTEELLTLYGDAGCAKVMTQLLEQSLIGTDGTVDTADYNAAGFHELALGAAGFTEGEVKVDGCAGFEDSTGAFDTSKLDNFKDMYDAIDFTQFANAADIEAFCFNTGDAVGDAGWDNFDGTAGAWIQTFTDSWKDADGGAVDFGAIYEAQADDISTSTQTCVDAQHAAGVTDPDTIQSACFGGGGSQGETPPGETPPPQSASVSSGTYTKSGQASCQNGATAENPLTVASGELTGIGPSSQTITATSATACSIAGMFPPATCAFTSNSLTLTNVQFGQDSNQTCTVTYTK